MVSGPTWVVMARDVSHAVRVANEPHVVASLVVDAETGLVRGVSMAATLPEACAQAMHAAMTQPAGPLPPDTPAHVVCSSMPIGAVLDGLKPLLADQHLPTVVEHAVAEAEDIFDSFVGHMAGRHQPEQFPTTADWQFLFAVATGYLQAEPWLRWSDVDHLDLAVELDGAAARYVAVVIGQEGIQRGLALYPGQKLPAQVRDWRPGEPVSWPADALLLWLDPPAEVPPEFAAKAARYGWPDDADLLPVCLATAASGGPADLDQRAAHHLTLAIVAVLAHDRHRATPGNGSGVTTGQTTLAGGQLGGYRVGSFKQLA